ncbi:MAG: protein kinase domain-containing protein [Burkholderiales bacterium]
MAKIIVIEDELQIRLNLQMMLKAEGHDVAQAANGREGLERIAANRPDLVLCDVMMPELDGFGVLEALRAKPENADLPFVFLTALDDRASMRRGMNLGADDFLNKPFTRDELLEAIKTRLAKHKKTLDALSERIVAQPDEMRARFRGRATGQPDAPIDDSRAAGSTGKMLVGTVLFSDIRNFTTISERLTSAQTAELLNAYFQKACAPVLAQKGRVVKLLGDGMMAVFASDDPTYNHARAALMASLGIALVAYRFGDWIHERHGEYTLPKFSVGVGMHSGEMIETNMGPVGGNSATLIGDSVNVAARLEAQTKEMGWPVIASRATVDAAGPGIITGKTVMLDLRGRSQQIEAVEITGTDKALPGLDESGELPQGIRDALASNAQHAASMAKSVLSETLRMITSDLANAINGVAPPTISGYRIISKIGQGGMSHVYLTCRDSDGTKVVLKILNVRPADDAEMFQRFAQEYALISSAQHNNVVQIFDHGFTDDYAFIAMEYLPKGTLNDAMGKGLDARQCLSILAQLSGGLAEMHARGIIHRDLKPANIMVRDDGTMAIADFGIAKKLETGPQNTRHGELFGTPYYIAPELIEAQPASQQSDIYSLGVIFYEMLAGKKPFDAPVISELIAQHLRAPIPRLPVALAEFQPMVDRMLAKNPAHRFADASQLLDAVDTLWSARATRTQGA